MVLTAGARVLSRTRDMVPSLMPLPGWIGPALRWLTAVLAVAFFGVATFAAVVMPYRFWDSLAFGSWSRLIADTGHLWANQPALFLQRPLFYVEQGLAWRVFGDEMWLGRLLSLSFVAILAVATWSLARQLVNDRDVRMLLPPLAVGIVLSASVVATYAAAGMSDVPVAALVAATGAAVWWGRRGWSGVALVAALAAAAVLAKPTALLAFAGLLPAALVLWGRRASRRVLGLAAGLVAALAYDLWQAHRIDSGFSSFLTAGNGAFWRARGAAARWDAVARAEWLGGSLRLLVVFGLVYAVSRAVGARTRVALACAAPTAVIWSITGPVIADGRAEFPFSGNRVGVVAWLVLAAAMLSAPFLAVEDRVDRRSHAGLAIWAAPVVVAWIWQRADEVRHLAPAWAPLVLMTAAALATVSLALARLRSWAVLVPAAAVALLVLGNVLSIDGLGRSGWRGLLDLGPSGWTSRAATENYAYGPFSYELDLARENAGDSSRIVSSDGRLAYFFPGRVDFAYPQTCAELRGARFFSFLASGESLAFAQQAGQQTDPLGWLQCRNPRLEMVGEQQGIYAAFVVATRPARPPTLADCHLSSTPAGGLDAVFGDGLTYAEGKALVARALQVGFRGTRLEQTGCSTFRAVDPGFPPRQSVQTDFRGEAARVGLTDVTFVPAVRYPEVSPDAVAVQ
jgi:hypothetical protein